MRIDKSGENYELEVTKGGVLYRLTLDANYQIVSNSALGKETPSYIWKANKKESFFGDFDDWYEDDEYEEYDDDDEYGDYEEYDDDYREYDEYDDDYREYDD